MPSETNERRITSVKTYVDEITKFRSDNPAINAEQWFFRGQKNASWEVRPNIFRGDNLASEHIVIDRAQRQNPVEFRDCANNFEVLTKLQHYGLGTRLLDVTLNPLVALYFATEPSSEFIKNKNGQYTQTEHDGRVYYKFVTGCSLRDLQIKIAMAIPFEEFGKSVSLEVFCQKLFDDNTISLSEFEYLKSNDYAEIIRILQTNSFIISTNSNIRLIQQRGAFLVSPAININTNTEIKSSLLSKAKMNLAKEFDGSFVIPHGKKDEIREELDFFNVNEATLFPELEHQMRYIQNQVKLSVGTVDEFLHYRHITSPDSVKRFENTVPNVEAVVRLTLPECDETVIAEIILAINEQIKALDWRMKESIHSHIRRDIRKSISDMYSAVDAKSKANEIINKLLE